MDESSVLLHVGTGSGLFHDTGDPDDREANLTEDFCVDFEVDLSRDFGVDLCVGFAGSKYSSSPLERDDDNAVDDDAEAENSASFLPSFLLPPLFPFLSLLLVSPLPPFLPLSLLPLS